MEYFIVALMSLVNPETNSANMYVFTKPHQSIEACKYFAVTNIPAISETLYKNFGPDDTPQMISCVTKDVIEQLAYPVEAGEDI